MKKNNHLNIGRRTIRIEAKGLDKLAKSIGNEFNDVCEKLLETKGKIITLGIGKSGHIAKKVSATFSSTGSPSNFINAAEALHGDIGGISKSDKVLIFSHSGQSKEIIDLLPYLKNLGCDFFSITGSKDSVIAKSSNINIDTGISDEACPLDLAPTTSTTASLAIGDAIAVALLEAIKFKKDDFAKSHPGGKLGRRLILKVEDVMKKGKQLPIVLPTDSLGKTLIEISSKGLGVALVIEKSYLKGIFTDGDLRRALNRKKDVLEVPISKLMSKKAKTITCSSLATEAIKIMQQNQIYSLVVVDQNKKPKGLIRMHDLVEAGLV
ncbi:MAG: D-arabinose 5-phosphate isomerase [Candidatus Marinimicrobia bacterium]|nr:D-arabinose 5-phosphate isomerase [Candidatus Neomarinimicrobiota bacterium]|tara:strand:- start:2817 stop:3785 length:969 start_codon:yes stop_codon:yes gene_type:complete